MLNVTEPKVLGLSANIIVRCYTPWKYISGNYFAQLAIRLFHNMNAIIRMACELRYFTSDCMSAYVHIVLFGYSIPATEQNVHTICKITARKINLSVIDGVQAMCYGL